MQLKLDEHSLIGWDDRIWTCDLTDPNRTHYQTVLHPNIINRLKYPKLHIVVCLVFLVTPLFQSHNLLHIWTLVENVGAAPLLNVSNIVCYYYTTLSIKAIVYCTWYNRSLINHRTIIDSLLLKHVCLNLVPPHRPRTYIFGLSVRCSKPTESLKVKFIPFITLIIFWAKGAYKIVIIIGAPSGARTRGPMIKSHVLYHWANGAYIYWRWDSNSCIPFGNSLPYRLLATGISCVLP